LSNQSGCNKAAFLIFKNMFDFELPKLKDLTADGESIADNIEDLEIPLSERRLGRITASQFHRISFKETKATGQRKADLIDWIQSQPNGLRLLGEFTDSVGYESYDKLKVEQLKQLIETMDGTLEPTAGALTYLDELLCEVLSGKKRDQQYSIATKWGIDLEPESLSRLEAEILSENPNFICKRGEFFIHPESNLIGATPDMTVYNPEFSLEIPFITIENKCPYNGANHIKTLRTNQTDKRYLDQTDGQMLCTKSPYFWFVSYDPRVLNAERQQVVIKYTFAELEEKMQSLNKELLTFAALYKNECEKLGIDLSNFLI
jgi:hypothetical protein